jgi:hypothetical protein
MKPATSQPPNPGKPLNLLSVVIPARDEEGCIAATVEHLHLELSLNQVPHEIIVVDDGSTDGTWNILKELQKHNPTLRPIKNDGLHGFGRAITLGIESMSGDALVIMMADESDDNRDVVRYWKLLNEGWDCVFGSRFMKGGGVIDYPWLKLRINRLANLFIRLAFQMPSERHDQRLQSLPQNDAGRLPAVPVAALQSDGGVAAQGHGARILVDGHAHHVAQSPHGQGQTQAEGNGQPLPVHRRLRVAGKIFQPR